MINWRKVLVGLGIVCALALLTGSFLAYYLITKSFPQEKGTIAIAGLERPVKVYRDAFGVPHIIAESDHDAYLAVGFIHGQERLWQMELIRRVGMGRLSEILGEPALKTDKMFRTLGLEQQARRILETCDAGTKASLQAYADGVNAYILHAKGKYPIEFDMLNVDPEPWTIEHSLLVSRLMGWELNYARWTDLLLGELVSRFGEEKARQLFPTYASDGPLIVPKELKGLNAVKDLGQFFDAERSYRKLFGISDMQNGSNAWVVSGAKTASGKPILANDPHLVLMAPGRWYELHIQTPTQNVAGVSIPGVPFVVIGRNERIAWGVTNAMMDDEDFYIEEVDSIQHPTKYKFKNGWEPIHERIDTIIVKNSLPVILSIYSTHRGPIVNRMEPSAQFSRNLISMRWTGNEISQEARAFYLIDHAANWQEFRDALRSFAVPAQNFVYADVDGNIGYRTGGWLPIRTTKGATLPFPGWTDEYDWKGFVPFDQMPESVNPPQGFIATANNKIVDDSYPYHISNHWEPPWRAERIGGVLKEGQQLTPDDMQKLQCDLVSPQARNVVPIIINAFKGYEDQASPDAKTALAYFRNWTFDMRKEDVATTIFEATFVKIVENTLKDEMGEPLFGLYDTLASIPLTVVTRLLQDSANVWFDDVRTPKVETRDIIVRKSLEDAVSELRHTVGGAPKEWQWGKVHQVTFAHVFGANKLLRPMFNVGPFAVGGSHSTVWKGDFSLSHPFANTIGPSTRQIFDLSDANDTRSVLPPGQSGHAFSKHYDDQAKLWLNGVWRKFPLHPQNLDGSEFRLLTLDPK